MNIEYIRSNPEEFGATTPIKDLEKILTLASQSYYAGEKPLISDSVYDILIDILEKRDNTNKLVKAIGYKSSNDKVLLPYFMGSMNKIKTKEAVKSWLSKYNVESQFVISDKLDGISALYVNNKLYTRGNGEYGRDISGIIKYLNLPKDSKMVVRGELIISKDTFEKNRGTYTSARSMVNGLIALKEDNSLIGLLDYVVFEVINNVLPFDQLCSAKKVGFKVPNYNLVSYGEISNWNNDSDNYLTNTLTYYRKHSKYDIDGIIISHNKVYSRVDGNPKNSVAFKSNNYGKVTTIKDIEWNASKYGVLIPRIKFEKVDLGSMVEYCTGFSAKYIFNNCLGPGSKIRITLSGDVIPYLTEIITPTYPKMPTVGYRWNSNKLHCILLEEDSDLSKKKILHFIKGIKIDYLSSGLISKLYDNGYRSINDILGITKEQLLEIDGFKETLSNKIIESIKSVVSKPIYLGLLMVASLEFNSGFGLKRIRKILDKYPTIMKIDLTLEHVIDIEGFQTKTAKQFIDNFDNFKSFLSELDLEYYVKESTTIYENKNITQKHFVLTGFRDPTIIEQIEKYGGIIQSDVNMKTDYLIIKDKDSKSGKVNKAKIMGVDIMLKDEFSKFII